MLYTITALESLAYQSKDLLAAMQADVGVDLQLLRVDGGGCSHVRPGGWLLEKQRGI